MKGIVISIEATIYYQIGTYYFQKLIINNINNYTISCL